MADKKYFCLCGSNCRYETMTKEQILAAITQAMSTGEVKDINTGFVTTIKEQNKGVALSFWVGTNAQYNALETIDTNCFYIITDDRSIADVHSLYDELSKTVLQHTDKLNAQSDYVVSKGTINGWTFRKWNSGVAECWGKFRHTVAITEAVSNSDFYRSGVVTELLPTELFKSITAVDITDTRTADDAVYLSRVKLATATKIDFFYLRGGTSSTTATFDTYITVKGTWK